MILMSKEKKNNNMSMFKNSGITLKSDISFTLEEETVPFFPVIQILISLMSSLSVVFMAESFLNRTGSMPIVDKASLIFSIITMIFAVFLFTRNQRFFKTAGVIYFLLMLFVIMRNIKSSLNGLTYAVYTYTKNAGFSVPYGASKIADITAVDKQAFYFAATILITFLIGLTCLHFANIMLLFLETFPIFEIGTFWGWEPYTWTIVLMITSWVIIIALSIINHRTINKKSSNTFAVSIKKRTYYLTSEKLKRKFYAFESLTLIIISAIVFAIGIGFSKSTNNYRPESFKKLRENISTGFRDLTFDLTGNTISNQNIPGRKKSIGGTNGGRLGVEDEINFSGKVAMYVTTDEFIRPIYLRGYVAEKYSNNTWDPTKVTKSVLERMDEMNYIPIDYNYLQYYRSPNSDKVITSTVITPVRCNSDLIYAPYGSYYSDCENVDEQTFDGMISPKKENKTYALSSSLPLFSTWEDTVGYLINQSANGATYNELKFIEDDIYTNPIYGQVPEYLEPLIDGIIKKKDIKSTDGVLNIQRKIREYFTENGYVYDTAPGATPEGEDFVGYFLTEQKSGFCTYYASAAVMIMRRLRYPARYVEGYIVEPTQFESDQKTIDVTDRSAHAWCEIYIQGFGWYPLEFTPGYEEVDNPNLTAEDKHEPVDSSFEESSVTSSEDSRSETSMSESSTTDPNTSAADSTAASQTSYSQSNGSESSESGANGGNGGTVSTSPSDSGGPGPIESGSGRVSDSKINIDPELIKRFGYLLMSLLFIVIFCAAAEVRRQVMLRKLEESIHNDDNSKAIISCYIALLEYLSLLGIENDPGLTDVQLSAKIGSKLAEIMPELTSIFVDVSAPAISAYMSGEKHSDDEAQNSRQQLSKARDMILNKLNFVQKVAAKWVFGLY